MSGFERSKAFIGYNVRNFWNRTCAFFAGVRKRGFTQNQKRTVMLLVAMLVIAVLICIPLCMVLKRIVDDPSGFEALLQENYALAAISFALINTLHVILAAIPGEPLQLLGGYLFGTWGGLVVVSAGLAVGEVIVFLLVKKYGTRFVELFVSQDKLAELSFFNDPKRLNVMTFLLMFIPGTPKDLVTYVIGLTPMTLGTWMVISVPARTFGIVISTVVGNLVAAGNMLGAAAMFAVVLAISALGVVYYIVISQQAREATLYDEIGRREWEQSGRVSNDAPGFHNGSEITR